MTCVCIKIHLICVDNLSRTQLATNIVVQDSWTKNLRPVSGYRHSSPHTLSFLCVTLIIVTFVLIFTKWNFKHVNWLIPIHNLELCNRRTFEFDQWGKAGEEKKSEVERGSFLISVYYLCPRLKITKIGKNFSFEYPRLWPSGQWNGLRTMVYEVSASQERQ